MGLSQALSAALAGVNTTQQGLSVIAGNVANANTPGYVDESISNVEVGTAGAGRDERRYHRHQPQSQHAAAGPIVDRDRPAVPTPTRLRRLYQQLQQIYGTPGSSELVRRNLQQFHYRAAVAVDQSQLVFQSSRRAQLCPGHGAESQFDDDEHPAIAHPGGAGNRHRRANGEQHVAADCADQRSACGRIANR